MKTKQKISTFLTFNGQAEAAMNFYAESIPGAEVTRAAPYGNDHPMVKAGDETRILHGAISIGEQEILCLDMTQAYPAPEFNWATSILIACESETEFDTIFNALSKDGKVMMGPEAVGEIRKCAWVVDQFGVTWQPIWT